MFRNAQEQVSELVERLILIHGNETGKYQGHVMTLIESVTCPITMNKYMTLLSFPVVVNPCQFDMV